MLLAKTPQKRWRTFAGEMIVPVLLCAYATHYYLSVAKLPRPDTNLLLIGPVYWILVVSSVLFAAFKLRDALRPDDRAASPEVDKPVSSSTAVAPFRAVAFLVLTVACAGLMPVVGFAVTIAAYTFLLLLALGVRSITLLVLTSVLLAGFLWAGLELFLNLRLPSGILF
ncbi:hypothetical protein H0A64_05675 [Alcaligenaceae bacterium]|nr:hypothetical protein [Alcaligenaceae bacterium]